LAIGLVGYVLWRFIQAIKDPEYQGIEVNDIVRRLSYGISGLAYAGLASTAVQIVIGSNRNGSNLKEVWLAKLIVQPFGYLLLGVTGAIAIGMGIYFLYDAFTANFCQKLHLGEISHIKKMWVIRIGRFGVISRGIIFLVIGRFVIQAAYQSDPSKVHATKETLQVLEQQPTPGLLGMIAFGLVAYGIHMGFMALYRRIPPI
jgi:hypothetical protein